MRLPCRPDIDVFPVCRGCDSDFHNDKRLPGGYAPMSDPKMVKADRWAQLWLGVICMVLIANLQYALDAVRRSDA